MGFLGINIPAELGGLGLGNLEALIVLEEFAKISSAVAFPIFESSVGPVRAIEHFGSDALKRRVVPAVCRGEVVVAVSMSERSEELRVGEEGVSTCRSRGVPE